MGKDKELKKHKSGKIDKKKKKEKLEVCKSNVSWADFDSETEDNDVPYEMKVSKKSSKDKSPKKNSKKEIFDYNINTKKKQMEEEISPKRKHMGDAISPKKKHFEEDISPKKKHKKDKIQTNLESPSKKSKHKDNHLQYESDELPSPIKKSKKYKELESDQKPSKKRFSSSDPEVNSRVPEISTGKDGAEDIKVEDDNEHQAVVTNDDAFVEEGVGWPKEDVLTLIEGMSKVIPSNDTLKYTSRVERLDWSSIQFKDYTAEECKDKWKIIEKKVRGFRILSEVVADAKLWLNKPWSNFYRSQKKNRHPDMPKRPLTSYMLFYMDKKGKYSRKNPTFGMTSLSKVVAEKFHKLSDSKKAKYVEMSKVLRDEYNEKMKHFLETHPNDSLAIAKKNKPTKNEMPGPPKPLPPLKLYIEEQLKKYEDISEQAKSELKAQFKENWKSLSNKKKVPWIRWANEAELKYLEELEVYKSQSPNFDLPKFKSVLSKEEVAILERMEGKPEKPPNSAYSLFSRLMLKDDQMKLKNYSPKERMREISRLWSAVSDEEKKQYAEKAKHLAEIYKLEYATYLESLPEDKRQEELMRSQTRRKRKKPDGDTASNGKKLKQIKIEDSFKKKEEKHQLADSESEESGQEDSDDEDGSDDEDNIFNDRQKMEELKKRVDEKEPRKPAKDPFELFKEIYMTNPGNKESRAKFVWNGMPDKEKDRYHKKLEIQKQSYILKFKEFLTTMTPSELKVYSTMKSASSKHRTPQYSSEDELSDESSVDSDSDRKVQLKPTQMSTTKTEETSSSSEESD